MAFVGTVEIAATRCGQIKFEGSFCILQRICTGVTASDDLNTTPAVIDELGKESELFIGREAIARRVGNDRNPACTCDPIDGVF